MLKKIYQEIVAVKRELQAIRSSLESISNESAKDEYVLTRKPYERRYHWVKKPSGVALDDK